MKKVMGIFRGFPGLGRVVSGVTLLETLRDEYGCSIEIISYLQGNHYLELKGIRTFMKQYRQTSVLSGCSLQTLWGLIFMKGYDVSCLTLL